MDSRLPPPPSRLRSNELRRAKGYGRTSRGNDTEEDVIRFWSRFAYQNDPPSSFAKATEGPRSLRFGRAGGKEKDPELNSE